MIWNIGISAIVRAGSIVRLGCETEGISVQSDIEGVRIAVSQADSETEEEVLFSERFPCWTGLTPSMTGLSGDILGGEVFSEGLPHPGGIFFLLMMMTPPRSMSTTIPPTLPQRTTGEVNIHIHESLPEDAWMGTKSLSRKIRRVNPSSSLPKFNPNTAFLRSDSLL